ncbi:hypothetical protein C7S13_0994 [Burkholderia cepacia]|nr:hypothetical protein [Burkholderia cepacia]MDW9244267.1 hypothetical protein [Burkholderia cepacia]QOH34176.1 hypothetical protein C7S14_6725 [Burkholderia cepacia]
MADPNRKMSRHPAARAFGIAGTTKNFGYPVIFHRMKGIT